MKKTAFTLFLLCFILTLHAQDQALKKASASRTSVAPRIDGNIIEDIWTKASVISGFKQYIPNYNAENSFPSEIRILYDNEAIYISAKLFDPHPDSILHQLGNRDEENLNADYFAVEFDTYNNQLDGYTFMVYASGVQADSREWDDTYDAVWHSAVAIDKNGWTVEMKIPYSALRFPAIAIQNWRLQILRYVRRYREQDQWALQVKEAPNDLVYWGKLEGIENVEPVTRLSLTPYLSGTYENYPLKEEGKDDNSYSISGGMDLKYGLDESFTLDMSLLPDFSQVQSDNKIKNLSAFETVYDEQRPFFKEAVDLFEKGGLFYSRRIGRIPLEFYRLESSLKEGESIKKNPPTARLLNATKLSGRNKHGLAIGIFNALTDNTYATIEDAQGNTRKILTDPRTNYNIVVFDQALKHNSSFYLINTNVIRDMGYQDANVTGSGITLFDKTNTIKLVASGSVSQLYSKNDSIKHLFDNTLGSKYSFSLGKVKGKFQTAVYGTVIDDHYSANDLGVTLYNNTTTKGITASFNQFEPKWISREGSINITYELGQNFLTHKTLNSEILINPYTTLTNYLSLWNLTEIQTTDRYDYYEPRTPGRYCIKSSYWGTEQGFSSDYRKTLALDGHISYYNSKKDRSDVYEILVAPLVRVNNHLFFMYSFRYMVFNNDIGYADTDSLSNIIFGYRDINEIENIFSGRYMFKNNLSLNLRFRHYWSKGEYTRYQVLNPDGTLTHDINYNKNTNFNFNAFTVDLVLWWEFAPGSRLNLIWKNAITKEDVVLSHNFWNNFKDTWESPQDNSLTLKVLYYLDYQYLKKLKKSKIK